MADHEKWGLDPKGDMERRDERLRNEKARFFPGAPPPPSKMQGPVPPFCPVRTGCVSIPVAEGPIISGSRQVQVQVQVQQFPCLGANCLWWDRQLVRCGITSLLEYMALAEESDDEDEAENEESEAPANGEVPPAEGG